MKRARYISFSLILLAMIFLTSCSNDTSKKKIEFKAPEWLQDTWSGKNADGTHIDTYKITYDALVSTEWDSSKKAYSTVDFFGTLDSTYGDNLSYQNTETSDDSHVVTLDWSRGDGFVIMRMVVSFKLEDDDTVTFALYRWVYQQGEKTTYKYLYK